MAPEAKYDLGPYFLPVHIYPKHYDHYIVSFFQIFEMMDAKARQDCKKEIDLLKVLVILAFRMPSSSC